MRPDDKILCTVCGRTATALGPGPGGRPNAACVHCGSLERHRSGALLMRILVAQRPADSLVVDVAPTPLLSRTLREQAGDDYLSLDFDPAADGRPVDVQASITHLPLSDGRIGFLFCSHVLEHVPDDLAAMKEIHRALSDDGVALVQVPRRRGVVTDEDPSAPREERIERFGQADHVRYYGDDFEDRLRQAGLRVSALTYHDVFSQAVLARIGAASPEELWLVTRGTDPRSHLQVEEAISSLIGTLAPGHTPPPTGTTDIDRVAGAMLALLALEDEAERAIAETEKWKSQYLWLRSRPIVQFGLSVKSTIRRGVAALTGAASKRGRSDDTRTG